MTRVDKLCRHNRYDIVLLSINFENHASTIGVYWHNFENFKAHNCKYIAVQYKYIDFYHNTRPGLHNIIVEW